MGRKRNSKRKTDVAKHTQGEEVKFSLATNDQKRDFLIAYFLSKTIARSVRVRRSGPQRGKGVFSTFVIPFKE